MSMTGSRTRSRKHSAWWYVRSVLRQTWDHPSNSGHRLRSVCRAAGWQLHKRVSSKPRDVDYFGYTLRCHPDSGCASNVIYFGQQFDTEEMTFCQQYLEPGDGFVDAGANIGTYTLLALSLVGPAGRVVAYEPDPVAARRFRENMDLNGIANCTLHEACVADSDGATEFLDGADVSNQMVVGVAPQGPTRTVSTVTLDDTLEGQQFALGKLDVEGAETIALTGATGRLAAADPPVWLVEMMDWQLRKLNSSYSELVQIFQANGFEFATFDTENRRLEYIAHDEVAQRSLDEQHDQPNLIAVHASHRSAADARLRRGDAPG